MKIYIYSGCSTCTKALKWLDAKKINYTTIPIREHPPDIKELTTMKNKFGLTRLFNTSGMDYRAMNMKEKLPTMSEQDALKLLSKNGNLIKRPFCVDPYLVGFKEDEWESAF